MPSLQQFVMETINHSQIEYPNFSFVWSINTLVLFQDVTKQTLATETPSPKFPHDLACSLCPFNLATSIVVVVVSSNSGLSLS
jgi:hypothetical protein